MSSILLLAATSCSEKLDNSNFIDPPAGADSNGSAEVVPDEVKAGQVKVISFNVRTGTSDQGTLFAWDKRKAAVKPLMTKENPTVFGVQECLLFQREYILEQLPAYGCIGVGREDGKDSGEQMAIFYKKDALTVDKSGTFWLSETPDKPSKGWDASYKRTATWALFTVKENNKKFLYINTHLDHAGKMARANGIRLICEKLTELNPDRYPAVVTADFNSETSDEIFTPLKLVMKDARAEAPKTDSHGSYNAWGQSSAVIDHVFYSGFKALEFRTVREVYNGVQFVSDHYPVSALLEF